jgi:hypothetical protein
MSEMRDEANALLLEHEAKMVNVTLRMAEWLHSEHCKSDLL